MTTNQLLAAVIVAITGVSATVSARADEFAHDGATTGFYGGLAMRDRRSDSEGLQFGDLANAWSKFTLPAIEDGGTRTLAYGGYRWANDLAVEASVASAERMALRPDTMGHQGMGLTLANANDAAAKTWNVDVYTSWGFAKKMSLYGRLGYIQNEPVTLYPAIGVINRNRDGVNYGLGLRYDVNPVFGLRLEYARYGRLAGEPVAGVLPESDQLQLGLQFRF
jgi:opacity protein-like surface antigen